MKATETLLGIQGIYVAHTTSVGPSINKLKHLLETVKIFFFKKSHLRRKKIPIDPNLKEFWNKEKRKVVEVKCQLLTATLAVIL